MDGEKEMLSEEEIDKLRRMFSDLPIECHEKLGVSALGPLYRVSCPELGMCALKLLEGKAAQNQAFLKRFLHPLAGVKAKDILNCARIYRVGEEGVFFVLREFVQGTTLAQIIAEKGKLPPAEATAMIYRTALGLEALLGAGVVHKNLKPGNVLLCPESRVKLLDFSLPPTAPHTLSPEQCRGGKSDAHSDIYSLGALYYYCVAGRFPFCEGSPKEIMEAHELKAVPDIRESGDIPEEIVIMINRALTKDPAGRFQNYREVLSALESILRAEKTAPPKSSRQVEPGPRAIDREEEEDSPTDNAELLKAGRKEKSSILNSKRFRKIKQVIMDVASRLKTINQTLTLLENVIGNEHGSEAVLFLDEMLRFVTSKAGELVGAEHALVFMLDQEKEDLWCMLEKPGSEFPQEKRIQLDEDVTGEVATKQTPICIPYDVYDDPRSGIRQEIDRELGYRSYTMLLVPIMSTDGRLVAVVQLINKLKESHDPAAPLADRIDKSGFIGEDLDLFNEFAHSIRLILESMRSFYGAIQKQQFVASLQSAALALSRGKLDLNETHQLVMNEARRLVDADRSTLWLFDRDKGEVWAKIQAADSTVMEKRLPKNCGFVGQVIETKKPLLIPFDLYDHPGSETARDMDRETGFRTCSMMCMPLFTPDGELLGVTQLINKRRKGNFPPYDPESWPKAPACWKASFNQSDMKFLEIFNNEAGISLQNAMLFARVKDQEQIQRQKMAALSQLVSKIAHELNTPAAAIFSAIQEIGKDYIGLLEKTIQLLAELDPGLKDQFFKACRHVLDADKAISTKERRQRAKDIRQKLGDSRIEKSMELSQDLALVGFEEKHVDERLVSLLLSSHVQNVQESLRQLGIGHIHVQDIKTAVGRVIQLVKALKGYANLDRGELVLANLQDGIKNSLTILRNQIKDSVNVHEEFEAVPSFYCFAEQLEQVWTNLMYNAIQAMKGKGDLHLRIRQLSRHKVAVEVEDTGPGIPKEIFPRLFEPYFTTKPKGEGTGLGLHICRQIVDKHKGDIEVFSDPGKTRFRVTLPTDIQPG